VVEPGPEYEAVLERLEGDLAQLTDPETGEALVEEVVRGSELDGGAVPRELPDLFVMFKPHRRFMETVRHPRAELTQTRPELFRDTHHSQTGLVAGAGPAVGQAGDLGEVSPLDLAPTFLSLLGATPPPTMPGRPLAALTPAR
jgi:predicted AlkP superfamily phosphohydrolase/phosphomutase